MMTTLMITKMMVMMVHGDGDDEYDVDDNIFLLIKVNIYKITSTSLWICCSTLRMVSGCLCHNRWPNPCIYDNYAIYSRRLDAVKLVIRALLWHQRLEKVPESKVHGANMGPIWGRQEPMEILESKLVLNHRSDIYFFRMILQTMISRQGVVSHQQRPLLPTSFNWD